MTIKELNLLDALLWQFFHEELEQTYHIKSIYTIDDSIKNTIIEKNKLDSVEGEANEINNDEHIS